MDRARRLLLKDGIPVRIGSRALDLLVVLTDRAGEIVGKRELLDLVWRGVVVDESSLRLHIGSLRRTIGDDGDGAPCIVNVVGVGYSFVAPVVRSEPDVASLPASSSAIRSNLLAPVSPVLGRSAALSQLQDRLSKNRIVTLSGPGGIGKTALAMEAARGLSAIFQGDRWIVELGPVTEPDLVPSAVATVIGLSLGADISAKSVARGIGQRTLLLVLDNCEHVVDAAAALAENIVRHCPHVTILATSREVLRIAGEYVYRVPPLDVPNADDTDPDHVREHSAVQLFVARYEALQANPLLQPDSLSTIATICRRLDGIPLAVEFAAARAATLGIAQVAAHLDDRFALLIGGSRTALPRHQTLRATLDWSYDLLHPWEQRLLRHLAVFSGGFTLEAAAAVMDGSETNNPAVADGISNLVSKSLVTLASTSTARWSLLETIRAYAHEKLIEHDENGAAARRHAEYFRDLVTPRVLGLQLQPPPDEICQCEREISNVRTALDWAFGASGDVATGVALTAGYIPVWLHLRLMIECRDRTEHALDRLGSIRNPNISISVKLHLALGIALIFTMTSAEQCRTALIRALEGAKTLDDVHVQILSLWLLWILNLNTGECRSAQSVASDFAQTAERTGDTALVLTADRLIGSALHFGDDQSGARRHLEHLLKHYTVPKDQPYSVWLHYDQRAIAQAMLARVLVFQGLIDQAEAQLDASLEAAKGRKPSIYEVLRLAAFPVALMTGDLARAESAVQQLLHLALTDNAPFWTNAAYCLEARLQIERGEFDAGTTRLCSALQTHDKTGWTIWYPESLGALAQGMAGLGRFTEGMAVIARALAWADRGGETYFVPELLRIKGELCVQQAGGSAYSIAEDLFKKAAECARDQGSLLWELRAALSLARLHIAQNRCGLARGALETVYKKFTEGFETADLIAARGFLKEL